MRRFGEVWGSYFIRLVMSYILLAIVLIAAVGGYLFTQANGLMVGEMTRESTSRLNTAKDYLEKNVLQKYVDGLTSRYFVGIEPDLKGILYNLLDTGWEGNISNIVSLVNQMNFIRSADDGIAGITIFFNKDRFVLDNNYFYTQLEAGKDQAFIEQLATVPKQRWIGRTLPDGKQVLTYVLTLPYGFPEDKAKGHIYIDIRRDYLSRSLAQVMNTPFERLYVLNGSDRPLLSTGPEDPLEADHVLQALSSTTDSNVKIEKDSQGSKIFATLNGDSASGSFQYTIVRPFDTFVLSSKQFQQQVIVSCALMLLLGWLIAFVISKRFYVPLKALLHTIRGLYQNNPLPVKGIKEYKLIDHTLQYLDDKIAILETKVKKNEITNFLLGNMAELQSVNLPLDCLYVTVNIQLARGDSESFRSTYLENGHSIPYEIAMMSTDQVVILYFLGLDDPEPIERVKAELIQFRMVSQWSFSASIGPSVSSLEDIRAAHQLAKEGLLYTYLYGPQMIIADLDLQMLSSVQHVFAFTQIKNAIRAGNTVEAERFLTDFAIRSQASVRIEVVELSVMQLLTALSEAVLELNLHHIIPSSELFRAEKKPTFEETMDWIRGLVIQMTVYIQVGKTKGHTELVHRLKTYIDEHLHEELSLDVLSEVASLSSSYISTLFADILNISFTDYVTKARLQMATELLKTESSLTVADIATRVGYRNSQYFCTKFKAKYGITPMQYRNAWAGSGIAKLELK
ncbi:helix-turn-helix domain-containing protein [Paenibacillus hodogayensis]|uniref:Helix-turn-helix domain-containing protein n=1 Tax=Paenibacillus hodogayensis TaxID=279208 RepID=A0ABV5W8K9_9BACL